MAPTLADGCRSRGQPPRVCSSHILGRSGLLGRCAVWGRQPLETTVAKHSFSVSEGREILRESKKEFRFEHACICSMAVSS